MVAPAEVCIWTRTAQEKTRAGAGQGPLQSLSRGQTPGAQRMASGPLASLFTFCTESLSILPAFGNMFHEKRT